MGCVHFICCWRFGLGFVNSMLKRNERTLYSRRPLAKKGPEFRLFEEGGGIFYIYIYMSMLIYPSLISTHCAETFDA